MIGPCLCGDSECWNCGEGLSLDPDFSGPSCPPNYQSYTGAAVSGGADHFLLCPELGQLDVFLRMNIERGPELEIALQFVARACSRISSLVDEVGRYSSECSRLADSLDHAQFRRLP